MNGQLNQIEANLFDRLNHVEAVQAQQGAKLDAIQQSLDRLNKRADQPTNWFALGGFIFAAFSTALAIMALSINPVSEKTRDNAELLRDREALIHSASPRLDSLESADLWFVSNLEKLIDRDVSLVEKVSRLEGRVAELDRKVDAIDSQVTRAQQTRTIKGEQ